MKTEITRTAKPLRWGLFFVLSLFIFNLPLAIHAETAVSDDDYEAYKKAIEDTRETTQAEISKELVAVVPRQDVTNYLRLHGDEIRWNQKDEIIIDGKSVPEKTRVLVTSFMKLTDWETYYKPSLNKEYAMPLSAWVTVVPEMKTFFVGKECPPTRERIVQALGLHPHPDWTGAYKVMVEMWVDPDILFRPCPDPEITDHEAELATRIADSIFWKYPSDHNAFLTFEQGVYFMESAWSALGQMNFQQWYENRTATMYSTEGDVKDWGWPWTRLGYTYDWGNPDDHVGLSEFIVRIDPDKGSAAVIPIRGIIEGTEDWNAYFRCGPKAPMMMLSNSGTTLTLDWTTVPDASGYYLLYKQAERGARFEPPFDAQMDMGDTNRFSTDVGTGACFFVAVQSYSQEGTGGISNIEYFSIPRDSQ